MRAMVDNDVDQIRELIFGSQMKDFEVKFTQLNAKVDQMKEDSAKAINESYMKLHKEIERSMEVVERKIDTVASTAQKEKTKLRELLDTTDEALQDQLSTQKDEFLSKLKIMKESVDDEHQQIDQDLQAMKQQIEKSLEVGLKKLSDEKLSRDVISQALIDMAMKMQSPNANLMPNNQGGASETKQ